MAETTVDEKTHEEGHDSGRRDFLYLTAAAVTAVGVAGFVWPFIDSMNPAADSRALATVDVDLGGIEAGQAITVMWRGTPVFVRHRTPGEIEAARAVDVAELKDPETDAARVQEGHEPWLVVIGVCTHLGCVPLGNRPTEERGRWGGWFCPCHGSHYDTAGRIRQGPAPRNLDIPTYAFLDDTTIQVGEA
jgi:ubiquinol-cytochrome c reductase iron-sulfur subunit